MDEYEDMTIEQALENPSHELEFIENMIFQLLEERKEIKRLMAAKRKADSNVH